MFIFGVVYFLLYILILLMVIFLVLFLIVFLKESLNVRKGFYIVIRVVSYLFFWLLDRD